METVRTPFGYDIIVGGMTNTGTKLNKANGNDTDCEEIVLRNDTELNFKQTDMKTTDLHARKCAITDKGMSEGFHFNDNTYKEKEVFVKVLRENIPSFNADINIGLIEGYDGGDALGGGLIPTTISDENLLGFSYDNNYHYWTEWYDFDEMEEEGVGYDDDGNLYEFKNNEWVKQN